MKALVLTALAGLGLLALAPGQAEAGWGGRFIRGCREVRCRPVAPVICQPAEQPPCGSVGYSTAYPVIAVQQRPVYVPAPTPVYERPCHEGRLNVHVDIQIQRRPVANCYVPPCHQPVPACQPRW